MRRLGTPLGLDSLIELLHRPDLGMLCRQLLIRRLHEHERIWHDGHGQEGRRAVRVDLPVRWERSGAFAIREVEV